MCVFCKIINGEIPCYKIYETNDLVAFLDISQATKGHTLIVPKEHYENYLELDDVILSKIGIAIKEVANLLSNVLGTKYFNFVNNCGSVAGQSVMHVHFHIIPRYQNDNFKMHITENEPNFNKLKALHQKIIQN